MIGVSGWMFLLIPAHLGCPGQNPESCKMVMCVCVCVCYLFISSFGELTYRSDWSAAFRAWWLKRHGLVQGCAFWGFIDIAANLRGQSPPKPLLFGYEEAFSSQMCQIFRLSYYWNYCIDYNQILHSDKDHQLPFVGGPNILQTNSRRWIATILKLKYRYLASRYHKNVEWKVLKLVIKQQI